MTEKPKRSPGSIATRRALQGRKPNGEKMTASPAKLEALTRTAQYLANLPEDARAAAALRAFPPSNLREAMYRHAKGDSITESCRKTGVSPASFELYLRSDEAGQELRAVMHNVIDNEYAPNAFRFLNETVNDTAMPARVRVDAAKIIVDRAGYVGGAPSATDDAHKDLEAMTISELEAFIRKAEAELKDVTPVASEDENDDTKRATAPPPADDAPPH